MAIRYPFTPELLDALPEELSELFRGLELKLLQEIAIRLNISDNLNEVTVQDIRSLRSHGIDLEEIKKAIRETTGVSRKKLDELLDDVVSRNQRYYKDVVTLADITEPQTYIDQEDVWAIYEQTKGELRNITRSMGFMVRDGRHWSMLQPAKAYQWALDSAELQVQSGAISYNEAIRNAVRQLADSGLCVAYDNDGNIIKNHVQYESGWHNHVDVAVRRAVMTGVNQLNQKYREQSMDYLETDLVEVSAHVGARDVGDVPENHKLWQGKVYRWRKKSQALALSGGVSESVVASGDRMMLVQGIGEDGIEFSGSARSKSTGDYPDFEEVCGYGLGEGIGGWNCRHSFGPFIEGVMERTYTDEQLANIDPPPFEFEGKTYTAYEATQKQRQIESEIRKWKRRKAGSVTDEDKSAAGARLRRLNKKYREFSKAAGLPEQRDRLKVLYT